MAALGIPNHFQAKWESALTHLKPLQNTSPAAKNEIQNSRVSHQFIDTITFGLAPWIRKQLAQVDDLAKEIILPAARESEENKKVYKAAFEAFWYGPVRSANREFRAHFQASPHTIDTPDGKSRLKATLFRSRTADASTPTLIYFQPNGCISAQESDRWLLKKSIEKNTPMNFVVFDYRAVGESTGIFNSTNDLLIDGASIVQWVRTALRTPDDRIHFYGYSLGGAIAAQTKALFRDQLTGRMVSERSLSSSYDMISAIVHSQIKPRLRPIFRPLCYLLVPLAAWLIRIRGYGIDAVGAFKNLKGKKLVVYHPLDPVIPFEASLARRVQTLPHLELLLKQPSPEIIENHHCEPLSSYGNAEEEIARFTLRL